jgi:hypothetical protein
MSAERLAISRAFGAQVMTVGDFHVNDALAKVAELGREPGYFAPQQFDSEWNVEENRTWLGPGRWPGGDKTGAVPCVGLYQHDRGAASSTAARVPQDGRLLCADAGRFCQAMVGLPVGAVPAAARAAGFAGPGSHRSPSPRRQSPWPSRWRLRLWR